MTADIENTGTRPPAEVTDPGAPVSGRPVHLAGPWQDPALAPEARADALIDAMTLKEKVSQLFGVWVGASDEGGEVAPFQHDMEEAVALDDLLPHGLGQLTRPFGTAPVDPAVGALSLSRTQERIARANRFGIPALAHEECLAGFATWGATAYPVPLSWGATFDPELIREMAAAIGRDLRSVGVHQGLAPVLDVVRDARWGRVEETIGEDPYLVGTVATAYVRGLESAGVVATLKHFAGYSASTGGDLAPVGMGARNAPTTSPCRDGRTRKRRAVRHARLHRHRRHPLRGRRTAADRSAPGHLGLRRDRRRRLLRHRVPQDAARGGGDLRGSGRCCTGAGVDVELPTVKAFGSPLTDAIAEGLVPEALVDRAVRRVLVQKARLGLLDADWKPVPPVLAAAAGADGSADGNPEALRGTVRLDTDENRALARRVAEQAVVLLRNDGTLPLAADAACGAPARIALIRPQPPRPRRPSSAATPFPSTSEDCTPAPARHRTAHPARGVRGGVPPQRDRHRARRGHRRPGHRRVRRGGRTGQERRPRDPRTRRPGRSLRARHERGGLRRGEPGAPRCPAAPARHPPRHGHPRRRHPARRAPLRPRAGGGRGSRGRAVVLPRRGRQQLSPRCSAVAPHRPACCPSACRATRAPSPPRTWRRGWAT